MRYLYQDYMVYKENNALLFQLNVGKACKEDASELNAGFLVTKIRIPVQFRRTALRVRIRCSINLPGMIWRSLESWIYAAIVLIRFRIGDFRRTPQSRACRLSPRPISILTHAPIFQ